MNAAHLFDPAPFTKGEPKKVRRPNPTPPSTRTVVGERWRIFATGSSTSTAHHIDGWGESPMGSGRWTAMARCGKTGAVLTVDAGQPVTACPKCIERGARP